jgi:hypothetical protein
MMHSTTGHTPDFDSASLLLTDADVLSRVDELIDSGARATRSLWLFFVSADGAQLPVVVPIDDVPPRPVPHLIGTVCTVIAGIIAEQVPGGSAILALTRPGPAAPGPDDRYWARSVQVSAQQHNVAIRMLCLATPGCVRQLD